VNLEKWLRGFARPLVSALQLISQNLSWRCTRLLALPTMGGVLGAILVLGAWLLLIRG